MEDYPYNTARDSAFFVKPEDLSDFKIQRHVIDRPFIDVGPTMPGYDYLWSTYQPYRSTAGFNRGYVATGTVLRDGTLSHYKDHQLIHATPPVQPSYSLGSVSLDRPEGVSESTMIRDGCYLPKGTNAHERGTIGFDPVYSKGPLPDLSLMKPYDAVHIVHPGTRGGISTRNVGRYHETPFSIKMGEYFMGVGPKP